MFTGETYIQFGRFLSRKWKKQKPLLGRNMHFKKGKIKKANTTKLPRQDVSELSIESSFKASNTSKSDFLTWIKLLIVPSWLVTTGWNSEWKKKKNSWIPISNTSHPFNSPLFRRDYTWHHHLLSPGKSNSNDIWHPAE